MDTQQIADSHEEPVQDPDLGKAFTDGVEIVTGGDFSEVTPVVDETLVNIQLPTVGRIVHFYPKGYDLHNDFYGKMNGAEFLPAIVTQVPVKSNPTLVNLTVFTPFGGIVQKGSIPMHAEVLNDQVSYWIWPPRS